MFHATGLGSCLINDSGPNLRDLFEPDSEIVVYRSIEECVEKVRYLLDHDEEREAIAEAGRRRTLRDHTYARRSEQLDALIAQALKTRAARPKVGVTSG
jgi:spore maturation protein CgeB